MTNDLTLHVKPPPGGHALPDTATHRNRMKVPSSSSNSLHLVSQRISTGNWECSCMAWIRTRTCPHTRALGLKTVPKLLPGPSRTSGKNGTFRKPDYGTYDTSNGYGSPAFWQRIFNETMGIEEATRVVGTGSPLEILGIARDAIWKALTAAAQFEKIRNAWKDLIMRWHPDHEGGNADTFRSVQAAYEVIENRYDKREKRWRVEPK